jgi:hypothetical protein
MSRPGPKDDYQGPIEERLSNRLELNEKTGCWLFTGPVHKTGYGRLKFNGHPEYVHRISWIIHNGQIPDGMVIRHKCHIRACCNPEHLILGTHKENINDRSLKYIANAFPLYHY